MKYWNEIVKASLYKLFIDETDDDADEYTNKMPIIANECLHTIANDIKACVKSIIIERNKKDLTPYKMPNDFIAFAETSPIRVTKDELIEIHPKIMYVSPDTIILPEVGQYHIFYNATYGDIPSDIAYDSSDETWNDFDLTKSYTATEYNKYFNTGVEGDEIVFNGIPSSILECLPTYIAATLLEQDDLQRSMILRNEYETMIHRLETNVLFENENFTSPGGWY